MRTQIRAGVNAKMIQRNLGHESIVPTFVLYGSMFVDDDDRARYALNQLRPAAGVRNSRGIRGV